MPLEEARRARGTALRALPRSKVAGLKAFRRVRADRIIGFLGILFVVLSVYMMLEWEKPPPVFQKYAIDYDDNTTRLPEVVGNVSEGNEASRTHVETFELAASNVSEVIVWIAWEDVLGNGQRGNGDIGEGDVFTITVEAPDGTNRTATVAGEEKDKHGVHNLLLRFPVAPRPSAQQVIADTEPQARALAANASKAGIGAWKVTVRLDAANDDWDNSTGRNDELIFPTCTRPWCREDTYNPFTLHFEYVTYAARFTRL